MGAVVWKAITWRSPNTPEGMTVGRASNKAQHSIPRPVNTLLGLAMVIQRAPSVQTYPPEEVGPGLCRAPEHNLASKGMGMVLGSAGGTQQLMQPASHPAQPCWQPAHVPVCSHGHRAARPYCTRLLCMCMKHTCKCSVMYVYPRRNGLRGRLHRQALCWRA